MSTASWAPRTASLPAVEGSPVVVFPLAPSPVAVLGVAVLAVAVLAVAVLAVAVLAVAVLAVAVLPVAVLPVAVVRMPMVTDRTAAAGGEAVQPTVAVSPAARSDDTTTTRG